MRQQIKSKTLLFLSDQGDGGGGYRFQQDIKRWDVKHAVKVAYSIERESSPSIPIVQINRDIRVWMLILVVETL